MTSENDMEQEQLILRLIKAEMKNVKLIRGLRHAGAVMEDFYTDLGGLIVSLMGFEEDTREEMLSCFDMFMENLDQIPVGKFGDSLNNLSQTLYHQLLEKKLRKD